MIKTPENLPKIAQLHLPVKSVIILQGSILNHDHVPAGHLLVDHPDQVLQVVDTGPADPDHALYVGVRGYNLVQYLAYTIADMPPVSTRVSARMLRPS